MLEFYEFLIGRADIGNAYLEGRPLEGYCADLHVPVVADDLLRRKKFTNLDRRDDRATSVMIQMLNDNRDAPLGDKLANVALNVNALNRHDLISWQDLDDPDTVEFWRGVWRNPQTAVRPWEVWSSNVRTIVEAVVGDRFLHDPVRQQRLLNAPSLLEAARIVSTSKSHKPNFGSAQIVLYMQYIDDHPSRWIELEDGDLYWHIQTGNGNGTRATRFSRREILGGTDLGLRGSGAMACRYLDPDELADVVVSAGESVKGQRIMNEGARRMRLDLLDKIHAAGRHDVARQVERLVVLEHAACEYGKYLSAYPNGAGRADYIPSPGRPHKHGWVYVGRSRDGTLHVGFTGPNRTPAERCREEKGREPLMCFPGNEDDEHRLQWDARLDPFALSSRGRERSDFRDNPVVFELFKENNARDATNP